MDELRYTALKAFNTVNQRINVGDSFLASDLETAENGLSIDDLRQRRFIAKSDTASAGKAVDRAEEEGRVPLDPAVKERLNDDAAEETVREIADRLSDNGRDGKRPKA